MCKTRLHPHFDSNHHYCQAHDSNLTWFNNLQPTTLNWSNKPQHTTPNWSNTPQQKVHMACQDEQLMTTVAKLATAVNPLQTTLKTRQKWSHTRGGHWPGLHLHGNTSAPRSLMLKQVQYLCCIIRDRTTRCLQWEPCARVQASLCLCLGLQLFKPELLRKKTICRWGGH